MTRTEIIARGVCVKNGKILLCRNRGKKHAYLPGGHIEHRERAQDALAREIREELGLDAKVTRFLGCAENCFQPKKRIIAEINLLFQIELPHLRTAKRPRAKEKHLIFFWHPMDKLAESGMQPEPLRALIPVWRQFPGFSSSGDGWKILECASG